MKLSLVVPVYNEESQLEKVVRVLFSTQFPLETEWIFILNPKYNVHKKSGGSTGLKRDEDGYARGYVLEDASLKGTPEEWAKQSVRMYRK